MFISYNVIQVSEKILLLLTITSGASFRPKCTTANLNVVSILAQVPAPVKDIKVEPSDTSVLVTWNIVTAPKDSSYITNFDIYLNRTFRKKITRNDNGNQYNVTGLKPYSDYTIGIVALDGSSQRSNITYSESFKTTEAGKNKMCYKIIV